MRRNAIPSVTICMEHVGVVLGDIFGINGAAGEMTARDVNDGSHERALGAEVFGFDFVEPAGGEGNAVGFVPPEVGFELGLDEGDSAAKHGVGSLGPGAFVGFLRGDASGLREGFATCGEDVAAEVGIHAIGGD